MNQQSILINEQGIKQVMQLTGQKMRDCQRKAYTVSACRMQAGVVFANCLLQPRSFEAICKATCGTPFILQADAVKAGIVPVLEQYGYYVTDGESVVICGTRGELYLEPLYGLRDNYTLSSGKMLSASVFAPNEWVHIQHRSEVEAHARGIQLPVNFLGVKQTKTGPLCANDAYASNHYTGDIIVIPYDGKTHYYDRALPVNNAVFADTFNKSAGSWGRSGLIGTYAATNAPTLQTLTDALQHCFNRQSEEPTLRAYRVEFEIEGYYSIIIPWEDAPAGRGYIEAKVTEQAAEYLRKASFGEAIVDTAKILQGDEHCSVEELDGDYNVTYYLTGTYVAAVKAVSEEDAKKKAAEICSTANFDAMEEPEITGVKRISVIK